MPGRALKTGNEAIITAALSSPLGCGVQDADADFSALGGHSLLAMKLAAQLNRQVARQVTPGQVTVASTIIKLVTIIGAEEDSTRRMGFETILLLREGSGPTLSYFHPMSGFTWRFSVFSRYPGPQWSVIGIRSPHSSNPIQMAANLGEICETHLATLLEQQPHSPYYLLGYSPGGTLTQGTAARLRTRGEQVALLDLLDIWPPETQSWQEREANDLDPEVLAEINREREAFLAALQENTSMELFTTIEGNYADAVRLLTTTHGVPFDDKAMLLIAKRILQGGMSPERAWSPRIMELGIHRQGRARVDIISPGASEKIGSITRITLDR